MQRALDLAGLGKGRVSPNPMVGCVIVYQDRIIGEGWHGSFGGPHAEVNAINSVNHQEYLGDSTLYVNLEPCSHHGKTPPCADLIIASGIKRVVIANRDPNPLVAGKGMEKLRQHGIEVTENILKDRGLFLNRRFFTFYQKHRPYIILKWAQTIDGYLARPNFDSKWISNKYSRQLVHQMRAQEDAIMVGRNTAYRDDPALTVRDWFGKNPVRLVLDPRLVLPPGLKLFDGKVSTLCYNRIKSEVNSGLELINIKTPDFLMGILDDLYQRQINSILVEGGAKLLGSLLDQNIWDEARVFTSQQAFGEGIVAPKIAMVCQEERIIAGDSLKTYYHTDASY